MPEEEFNFKFNNGVWLANSNPNIADELQKLSRLKQKGVLMDAEYETRKKNLVTCFLSQAPF